MTTYTMNKIMETTTSPKVLKKKRVESIDLIRGIIMVIMALDHVRDYFHRDYFLYDPTDLSRTSVFLFFTRWITHYCAPIFIFLAGISAYLYGTKKSKTELESFLFTRGVWLVFVELVIIGFAITFNPSFPVFNLQVIWAIGICMIVMSLMVQLKRQFILMIAIILIAAHNLLDGFHIAGNGWPAFLASFLHEPGNFVYGRFKIMVIYPVIPWIGVMALGFYFGKFYESSFDSRKRRRMLVSIGSAVVLFFFLLRFSNIYGDKIPWSAQKNAVYTFLSMLNVTKYPPSLLYVLMTLGPAMIFLGLAEKPLNAFTEKLVVFGKVPFFYYVIHRYVIHLLAIIGAVLSRYKWSDMILTERVNHTAALKGYGFSLTVVYLVWAGLIIFLYPLCKWFERYKRTHQAVKPWLAYF